MFPFDPMDELADFGGSPQEQPKRQENTDENTERDDMAIIIEGGTTQSTAKVTNTDVIPADKAYTPENPKQIQRGDFFRTRSFIDKTSANKGQSSYVMAVCETDDTFNVYSVQTQDNVLESFHLFNPQQDEQSTVIRLNKGLSVDDALQLLAEKETDMITHTETRECAEQFKHMAPGWYLLSYAKAIGKDIDEEKGLAALKKGLLTQGVALFEAPVTAEALAESIHNPFFELSPDQTQQTTLLYQDDTKLTRMEAYPADEDDGTWNVFLTTRDVNNFLPGARGTEKKKIRVKGKSYAEAIAYMAKWENQNRLNAKEGGQPALAGPKDLNETQKEHLQILGMRGQYFRTAAELQDYRFDLSGMPHKTINGIITSEGEFPVQAPEVNRTDFISRLTEASHDEILRETYNDMMHQEDVDRERVNEGLGYAAAAYMSNLLSRTPATLDAITWDPYKKMGLSAAIWDKLNRQPKNRKDLEAARLTFRAVEMQMGQRLSQLLSDRKALDNLTEETYLELQNKVIENELEIQKRNDETDAQIKAKWQETNDEINAYRAEEKQRLDGEIYAAMEQLGQLREDIRECNETIASLNEEIDNRHATINELDNSISERKDELQSVMDRIPQITDEIRAELTKALQKREDKVTKREKSQDEFEAQARQEARDALKAEFDKAAALQAQLDAQLVDQYSFETQLDWHNTLKLVENAHDAAQYGVSLSVGHDRGKAKPSGAEKARLEEDWEALPKTMNALVTARGEKRAFRNKVRNAFNERAYDVTISLSGEKGNIRKFLKSKKGQNLQTLTGQKLSF
jgi:predicted  nucleic acid-binding Zn-ribbon protein